MSRQQDKYFSEREESQLPTFEGSIPSGGDGINFDNDDDIGEETTRRVGAGTFNPAFEPILMDVPQKTRKNEPPPSRIQQLTISSDTPKEKLALVQKSGSNEEENNLEMEHDALIENNYLENKNVGVSLESRNLGSKYFGETSSNNLEMRRSKKREMEERILRKAKSPNSNKLDELESFNEKEDFLGGEKFLEKGATSYENGMIIEEEEHLFQEVGSSHENKSKGEKLKETFANVRMYFYFSPGIFRRYISSLHAERKLFIFFWIHFAVTMIVWAHFAFIKNREQEAAVPNVAPNFYWKRIAPPLEFGSMHAILFQMALLPLTMSRLTIANLSTTKINDYIPFNRMQRIHIHLGYTMVFIVCLATLFFFVFFGKLCYDGEQKFCDKFTDEITLTGYGIFAMLLLIGLSSYFRYKIPYEVFYVMHHIVFLMYILAIAHTIDKVHRSGKRMRSQNFKWYTATLLFYVCDRIAMATINKHKSRIVDSSMITSNGNRIIKLVLERPSLFIFSSGQYAYLKIPELEFHSHPFSIASSPESNYLEFYIEVFDHDSWTGKLWKYIEKNLDKSNLTIEVQGPYGTPFAQTDDFSHAFVVGSGTGVVPLLSIFKQYARRLKRLDPNTYFLHRKEKEEAVRKIQLAHEQRKGSALNRVLSLCRRRKEEESGSFSEGVRTRQSVRSSMLRFAIGGGTGNSTELKRKIFQAQQHIYQGGLLGVVPVLGFALICLSLSWNDLALRLQAMGFEEYEFMNLTLGIMTIIFQSIFTIVAFCLWSMDSFFFYLDALVIAFSVVLDIFLYHGNWTTMTAIQYASYLFLLTYMTFRSWGKVVHLENDWRNVTVQDGLNLLDSMEFVWVTRSASLAETILEDIDEILEALNLIWTKEELGKVCHVSIYVTDKDNDSCAILKEKMKYSNIFIKFERPDFQSLMEKKMIDTICSCSQSHTLVAFCGSPQLSRKINEIKSEMNAMVVTAGYKHHSMDFVGESYGGVKSPRKYSFIANTKDSMSDETSNRDEESDSCRRIQRSASYGVSRNSTDPLTKSMLRGSHVQYL